MSLRSIIRKGRFYCSWNKDPMSDEFFMERARYAMQALSSHYAICVNAQSVWNDLAVSFNCGDLNNSAWFDAFCDKLINFQAIPKPKPPYEYMWLEAMTGPAPSSTVKQHCGALVRRMEMTDALRRDIEADLHGMAVSEHDHELKQQALQSFKADHPATVVTVDIWHSFNGFAVISGNITYWMDAEGKFQYSFRQVTGAVNDSTERLKFLMQWREAWILQTFARMNCRNVELRPIADGKPRRGRPNGVVPASVWHEIVVTSVPKSRSGGKDIFEKDEREIRAHWIRGHYADYRKGNGLFGKIHGLFWIPEHRRGNADLGQVIPEYTIQ